MPPLPFNSYLKKKKFVVLFFPGFKLSEMVGVKKKKKNLRDYNLLVFPRLCK
jgi:hypothetical protein